MICYLIVNAHTKLHALPFSDSSIAYSYRSFMKATPFTTGHWALKTSVSANP